jgi:hypothetical protein
MLFSLSHGFPIMEVRSYPQPLIGLVPGEIGGGASTGLREASAGLRALFAEGKLTGASIIRIRANLTKSGFVQGLTRNRAGFLFRNNIGEEVRLMNRAGGWDARIMNRFGNYLDELGNVVDDAVKSHGISIFSR